MVCGRHQISNHGQELIVFNSHHSINIQVTLVNEGLQGWKGPTELVDVIMLNHVLYFVPDYVSALRQCYEWLKPGGSIIILQGYDDNIFIQMGELFVYKSGSVLK